MTERHEKTIKKKRTKYNSGVVDALVEILSKGITIQAACGYVGINKSTFYRWIQEYPEFAAAIDATKFEVEARLLTKIEEQGNDDWRALAWILERRYPQDWSLKRELELNVNKSNGSNEVIEFLKQSREEEDEDEEENEILD